MQTLKLLAATALVGMVLLAFAGHHEHTKATKSSIHFFQRRDLAGSVLAPTPAPALYYSSAAAYLDPSNSGYPIGSQASAPAVPAPAPGKAAGGPSAGRANAPAPAPPAVALVKNPGGSLTGGAEAPAPTVSAAMTRQKAASTSASKGPTVKAPTAAAPAPALGRKGGKAAAHAPVPAPAGHSGQTGQVKGKKDAAAPTPAKQSKGKQDEAKGKDAKKAGKHAPAPAPEGMQSKGAKKVEGKGKSKDAKAAKAPNAHAPAPADDAAAKDTKKSSSWLPSVLALPGTGKATRTPSGSKDSAGAPAFAPAPGLGGAAAAFLRPAAAPKAAKVVKLVSPAATEHLSIPAAVPAPAPLEASDFRIGGSGRRKQVGKQAARAAPVPAPGPGPAQAALGRSGQIGQAPAPTLPQRGGTGFASLGNVFG